MGHWLGVRLRPARRRTATRSAAWLEVRVGDATSSRELTVGGGHAGGQLGWIHVGLGSADAARRSGSSGRTARPGRGCTSAADQFVDIERGAAARAAMDAAGPMTDDRRR